MPVSEERCRQRSRWRPGATAGVDAKGRVSGSPRGGSRRPADRPPARVVGGRPKANPVLIMGGALDPRHPPSDVIFRAMRPPRRDRTSPTLGWSGCQDLPAGRAVARSTRSPRSNRSSRRSAAVLAAGPSSMTTGGATSGGRSSVARTPRTIRDRQWMRSGGWPSGDSSDGGDRRRADSPVGA